MKTTKLIILGALIGTCSFATAQDGAPPEGAPKHKMSPEDRDKFDADKSGDLSDEEKATMKAALKAKGEERKAAMLAKFDANKDGTLDETEKAAMKAEMKANGKRPKGPKRPPGGPGAGGPGPEGGPPGN